MPKLCDIVKIKESCRVTNQRRQCSLEWDGWEFRSRDGALTRNHHMILFDDDWQLDEPAHIGKCRILTCKKVGMYGLRTDGDLFCEEHKELIEQVAKATGHTCCLFRIKV